MSVSAYWFGDPCLPTRAKAAPSGSVWLHEIKHDGYRLMVRRTAQGVRIKTRRGYDWTGRFPLITEAAERAPEGGEPLNRRKPVLAKLLRRLQGGIQVVEHIEAGDGATVFGHACKLGLEGIVSKRRDMPYQHGRSRAWLKIKNPASPAMQRVWEDRF